MMLNATKKPSATFLKELSCLKNLKRLSLLSIYPTVERMDAISEIFGQSILLECVVLKFNVMGEQVSDVFSNFHVNFSKLQKLSSFTLFYQSRGFSVSPYKVSHALSVLPNLRDLYICADLMMSGRAAEQLFLDYIVHGNLFTLKIKITLKPEILKAVAESNTILRFEMVYSRGYLDSLAEFFCAPHTSLKDVLIQCAIDEIEEFRMPLLNELSVINQLETFRISITECWNSMFMEMPYLEVFLDKLKLSTKLTNLACFVNTNTAFRKLVELVKCNKSVTVLSVHLNSELATTDTEDFFDALKSNTAIHTLYFHDESILWDAYLGMFVRESNISRLTLKVEYHFSFNRTLEIFKCIISGRNSLRRLSFVRSHDVWEWDAEEVEIIRVDFYEGKKLKIQLLQYRSSDVFHGILKDLVDCLSYLLSIEVDVVGSAIFVDGLSCKNMDSLRYDLKTKIEAFVELGSVAGEECLFIGSQ
ncbi:hypothetical protein HK098_006321 [Nowakowskiella sp. JEL0407]|nr:hypothetical protein HK098_006321 [Nowakowskiella sp. JEL0407]